MNVVPLTALDLALAGTLVVALALLSLRLELGLTRQVLVAAVRTVVQLLLVGLVLKWLFGAASAGWILLMAAAMVAVAGREVMRRQRRRFAGVWGYGIGTVAMLLSSFTIAVIGLQAIIGADPWYAPRYAIPILGMLLGNTMNGIALGINTLTREAWDRRAVIEARLILGASWPEAIRAVRAESIRTGLIPIVNAMAVAGVVSLPGMMTGQILAGTPPVEAVKYQILIMFLIAAGTGFGTLAAVWLGARRLFDERHRLRLDRLIGGELVPGAAR
jgi:putative ABC transport system permease protein